MKKHLSIPAVALTLGGLLVVGCSDTSSRQASPASARPASPAASPSALGQQAQGVPPYYESAEGAKPFPRLLPAAYFRGYPLAARAYKAASEIPDVAAQQPCYCFCDKFGHRSLLDCYASNHGAG